MLLLHLLLNEFYTLKGTGSRAGNVGINSTLPDQKLDIGGSVHIDANIFDSDNNDFRSSPSMTSS